MQYRAHILQIDPPSPGSVKYFLLLAQMPDDGRMENRLVIEGAHMGYASTESLTDAFRSAGLGDVQMTQLRNVLALNSSLAFLSILSLDAQQLRQLGFQTLAKALDALGLA